MGACGCLWVHVGGTLCALTELFPSRFNRNLASSSKYNERMFCCPTTLDKREVGPYTRNVSDEFTRGFTSRCLAERCYSSSDQLVKRKEVFITVLSIGYKHSELIVLIKRNCWKNLPDASI